MFSFLMWQSAEDPVGQLDTNTQKGKSEQSDVLFIKLTEENEDAAVNNAEDY